MPNTKHSDRLDLGTESVYKVGLLTVKVTVSLGEGALQVGAELMDGRFEVRAALLTQLLFHLKSTARETLRTDFQMGP